MESSTTATGNERDQSTQGPSGGIAETPIPLVVGAFVVGLVIGRFSSP